MGPGSVRPFSSRRGVLFVIRVAKVAFGRTAALFAACLAVSMVGCGGGEFAVAPAKGKVMCGGKPVSVGSVTFTPVAEGQGEPGKPATAVLTEDGTFVLSTYESHDGAVIGKHRVQYFAAEGGEDEEEDGPTVEEGSAAERQQNAEKAQKRKAAAAAICVLKGEMVVNVTEDGPNEFTVELVPASQAGSAEEDPAD